MVLMDSDGCVAVVDESQLDCNQDGNKVEKKNELIKIENREIVCEEKFIKLFEAPSTALMLAGLSLREKEKPHSAQYTQNREQCLTV